MNTALIDYEVYGYYVDQLTLSERKQEEVTYTFKEAATAARLMHKNGLQDVKIVKSDGWDLYQSWEFVNNKLTRTE